MKSDANHPIICQRKEIDKENVTVSACSQEVLKMDSIIRILVLSMLVHAGEQRYPKKNDAGTVVALNMISFMNEKFKKLLLYP